MNLALRTLRIIGGLSVLAMMTAFTGCQKGTQSNLKDISYQSQGHSRQKLDLYLPDNPKGAPVILWIHGGGWEAGDKAGPPITGLKSHGYAIASMNYRYSKQAPFPAQLEDAKAAVRWLRAHAGDYGYDGNRIAVWGHSAGGTLVALLGVTANQRQFDVGDNLQVSSAVQAVVAMSGPTDFPVIIDHAFATGTARDPKAVVQVVGRFLGAPLDQAKAKGALASPVTYASAQAAPTFIVHGEKDPIVPAEQAELFQAALQKAGAKSELRIIPGADHGGIFDQETVRKAVGFIDRALGVQR